jgi:beta-glucanase (GH16 family)
MLHRNKLLSIAISFWIFAAQAFAADAPATQPASPWQLCWSDEFTGTAIDPTHWAFDIGNGFRDPKTGDYIWGWGNEEEEFYTDRPENAYVKDGMLHIRAVRESYRGNEYTSARMTTKGLFSTTYGRFEFRAKLPTGQGLWPALWLMPAGDTYGPWAASGEIDIMEARRQEPHRVVGTLHYGSTWPGNTSTGTNYEMPDGGRIDQFHVYGLDWEPGVIRWYVDGILYSTKRNWWSCSKREAPGQGVVNPAPADRNPWPAPYNKPFYIIINLAVGGTFVGKADPRVFPEEMLVNYVRVYKKNDYGAIPPMGAPDEEIAGDNLGIGKPATASSEESEEHAAPMANDGAVKTRWCARGGETPQWWEVDLQRPSHLTGAEIRWEMDGKVYQFIVEGSADDQSWQTLSDQSQSTSTSQTQRLNFAASGVRYLRVRITGLEKGSWASIDEVKVFGKQ